jgi:nucleoside-diphosphate-sugar epimerase
MRTVLISGGAGFIGSHLVDHFIKNGDRVVIVDNLYTGNMWNIQKYVGSDSFSFLRKDISTCTVNDFTRFKFDIVLHFASPASPIHYMKQPFMTMNANSKGTEFMLEIASRDHAKFLLASTSEIYGDPEVNPQVETYWGNVNSFGPRSCYDESKRFAETLTYLYIKQKNLNARIVRTFNVYGPRMQKDDGRAVPAFISQA